MSTETDQVSIREKSGECLYRYVPTGTYYARIKRFGKEGQRRLGTTGHATAKRKLAATCTQTWITCSTACRSTHYFPDTAVLFPGESDLQL